MVESVKKCRVCERALFDEPLLRYENMPAVAQNLPSGEMLDQDEGTDLNVTQCSGCGLVQLDIAEPVSYFREVIRAAAFSGEMREFRAKQFHDFVKVHSLEGKKILEIGCGRGEYLSIMAETGTLAFGLEYGDNAVRECGQHGLKVSRGFIDNESYRIEHAPFDAFFILNFLEHLPEPNEVLRGIYNNLTEGGVGLVEVPNFDMILRESLFSEFMSDHLFYFTKDTLRAVLNLNGFEVLSCSEVWHDYSISAVVKKRAKLDLSAFATRRSQIQKEIDNFIARFPKVAIWGAGHQAFAIMSMMALGGRIKYVVDSAPFKQGKFTPATHIPIVAPHKLRTEPVDAIIVMAGSYSDEVVNTLQIDFDQNLQIAILRDFGLEVYER